jgi:hypothetical protein
MNRTWPTTSPVEGKQHDASFRGERNGSAGRELRLLPSPSLWWSTMTISLLDAIEDQKLFGPWFRDPSTWAAWKAFLAALFGLPMTPEQLAIYQAHTGRAEAPTAPFREGWLVIGRRGGKSFIMALVAVYLATFRSYAPYLQPGERATVLVIAADKRQARVIIRYVRAMLNNIPMLKKMIERDTAELFDLKNSVTIEVGTASFRSTRGYTFAAVLCDEIAFWRTDDAAEPDYAILDAIRPGMATIPGSVLLCGSSPYGRRGALWDAFRRFWGKDDKPLVWKAATRVMNSTIDQAEVDRAMEHDEASARAEYGAEFRSDVEALFTREAIAAVVDEGVLERPKDSKRSYVAFVDPSGGSSDSMTLAIAHREGERAVLDAVRERKAPFSPEAVTKEFADLIKLYGLNSVEGDRYGGEWPREAFRKNGVNYLLAEKTRSELYLAMVPAVNSRQVDLIDVPRLENQLIALERRTSRAGKDLVDHPPGGHDDVANAVAGAIARCTKRKAVPAVTTSSTMIGLY